MGVFRPGAGGHLFMGRSSVQAGKLRRLRHTLHGVVLLLPILLCACRQNRSLVDDDSAYRVTPSRIRFDENLAYDEDLTVDNNLTLADSQRITTINYTMAPEPIRLRDRKEIVKWEMTLQEVIYHALSNSKVIRQGGGQFLSPNNSLLRSPDSVPTVYDRAIQESGVLYGQRGEQGALSEFDAQFTTRVLFGNNSVIQNARFTGLPAGTALNEDTGQFQSSLQKSLYSGGQIGLSHTWNYSASNNVAGRLFPSVYEGNMRAEYRQPLLAGAGSMYSMIAGPISDNIQGVTGVQQGILIARQNSQIALTDFEISVTNYLRDVEMQYGKLYLAFQKHQIELDNKQDAERILGIVTARRDASGSELARVVEAREGTLLAEQRVLEALDEVYNQESELRLLMGFTLQNERMIYPTDPPLTAEMKLDWNGALSTALTRRPELRRQKAAVKSAELQLLAAENLDRPRLDFLASAQTNGFGKDLLGPRNVAGTTEPLGNAYDRLLRFGQTGWNLGFEYSQPLGLRFANEQLKNNELKLMKAVTILQAQEADVLHQMTAAFQTVDRTFLAMKNHEMLVKNAEDRMAAAEADYNSNKDGRGYLDLDSLNRARDIYAQAYVKLGQARLEYSMALSDIEYRSGRLLEYHNVMLGNSPETAMTAVLMSTPDENSSSEKGPELAPPPVPEDDQKPQPPAAAPPPQNDITDTTDEEPNTEFVSIDRPESDAQTNRNTTFDVVEDLFPSEEIDSDDWTPEEPDDKIHATDSSPPRDDSWTRDDSSQPPTDAEANSVPDPYPWAHDSPVEEVSPP